MPEGKRPICPYLSYQVKVFISHLHYWASSIDTGTIQQYIRYNSCSPNCLEDGLNSKQILKVAVKGAETAANIWELAGQNLCIGIIWQLYGDNISTCFFKSYTHFLTDPFSSICADNLLPLQGEKLTGRQMFAEHDHWGDWWYWGQFCLREEN